MESKDRGLLKKELYQDQAQLIQAISNVPDEYTKNMLQAQLDRINKYILICINRNKF